MAKKYYIPKQTREIVVSYCNNNIVPDKKYIDNPTHSHPIEWFKDYFGFIDEVSLRNHLADAYYQARFLYKMMQGLRLTSFKKNAIIKFQIQQYASIYEALIDFTLDKYRNSEVKELLKDVEYKPVNALASNAEIHVRNNGRKERIYPCRKADRKNDLKTTRIDKRTRMGVDLGLLTQQTKQEFDELYDIRNNIHILKAAKANYRPSINESTAAFNLMPTITKELSDFIEKNK